jgi:hypothetical protein
MSIKKIPEFTTQNENGSFWVNGPHNCLGRFTPKAWEIYQNMNAPMEIIGTTKTLDVSMKPTDEKAWRNFVILMKSHHGIDLSDQKYPGDTESK